MPLFAVLFGKVLDGLNSNPTEIVSLIENLSLDFVFVGIGALVGGCTEMTLLNIAATRQIKLVREKAFASLLKQEVGWYDINSAGDVSSLLNDCTMNMAAGMGQKLGVTIHTSCTYAVLTACLRPVLCVSLLATRPVGFPTSFPRELRCLVLSIFNRDLICVGCGRRRVGVALWAGLQGEGVAGAVVLTPIAQSPHRLFGRPLPCA